MAASSTASISPLAVIASSTTTVAKRKAGKVNYVSGLNPFSGLKSQNGAVATLGVPECTERSFARIVGSVRTQGKGRRGGGGGGGGGGALSSKCNAAEEIFRIAAIINGLVLVGVAVGFILLRMEAFVEESE